MSIEASEEQRTTTWFVLVEDGQPISITTLPIDKPGKGRSVVTIDSDGQPDVADWFDPVQQQTVKVARAWDDKALAWGDPITPVVVDRLEDLKADPAIAAVTTRAQAAEKQAMLDKLGAVLGSERYRYATDSVEIGTAPATDVRVR